MLLEVKNISIVAVNKFGDGGVQPLAIWALHEKNGSVFQVSSPGGPPGWWERKQPVAGARFYLAAKTGAVIRGI
jgi:hypothetical protein